MKSGYPPRVAGKAVYFAKPEELRAWLDRHHDDRDELLVGFHKRGSGVPSVTWPEAVDEALCFGWIDGVRRSVDERRYTIRFTPRRPRSVWSAVNIRRAKALEREGRMRPAGQRAFARRADERSAIYSYEQRRTAQLDPEMQERFRAARTAWEFFQGQPPWYRRAAVHWVTSAKRSETRERRFGILLASSTRRRPIPPLVRPTGKEGKRA